MYHLLKGIWVFLFFLFSNISCTQKVIALEKNIATTKSFLFKKKKKKIPVHDVYHAGESITFKTPAPAFCANTFTKSVARL